MLKPLHIIRLVFFSRDFDMLERSHRYVVSDFVIDILEIDRIIPPVLQFICEIVDLIEPVIPDPEPRSPYTVYKTRYYIRHNKKPPLNKRYASCYSVRWLVVSWLVGLLVIFDALSIL